MSHKFFNCYGEFLAHERTIEDKMLDYGMSWHRTSYDDYDYSIEFHVVAPDYRLPEEAISFLRQYGFSRCWLNHSDGFETYYDFHHENIHMSRSEMSDSRKKFMQQQFSLPQLGIEDCLKKTSSIEKFLSRLALWRK